MPRAPRIQFAGAFYHVMNRGNHAEAIFRDEVDRRTLLAVLAEACRGAGWCVHSFVFMRNHYHLLIETSRPTLVKGMQWINSTYTRRYNLRHRTWGHLFQGRYKALLVDPEAAGYFLTVSDYIHLNPARARLAETPQQLLRDPWSSAGWLSGVRRDRPDWLRWERVYGELGLKNWRGASRHEYREHLVQRMLALRPKEPEWARIRQGWCLGSEGFVAQMKERLLELADKPRDSETWNDSATEEMEEARAERLLAEGLRRWKVARLELLQADDRFLLAVWVRQECRVSVLWLAHRLGLKTRGGMSSSLHRLRLRLANEPGLRTRWKSLLKS